MEPFFTLLREHLIIVDTIALCDPVLTREGTNGELQFSATLGVPLTRSLVDFSSVSLVVEKIRFRINLVEKKGYVYHPKFCNESTYSVSINAQLQGYLLTNKDEIRAVQVEPHPESPKFLKLSLQEQPQLQQPQLQERLHNNWNTVPLIRSESLHVDQFHKIFEDCTISALFPDVYPFLKSYCYFPPVVECKKLKYPAFYLDNKLRLQSQVEIDILFQLEKPAMIVNNEIYQLEKIIMHNLHQSAVLQLRSASRKSILQLPLRNEHLLPCSLTTIQPNLLKSFSDIQQQFNISIPRLYQEHLRGIISVECKMEMPEWNPTVINMLPPRYNIPFHTNAYKFFFHIKPHSKDVFAAYQLKVSLSESNQQFESKISGELGLRYGFGVVLLSENGISTQYTISPLIKTLLELFKSFDWLQFQGKQTLLDRLKKYSVTGIITNDVDEDNNLIVLNIGIRMKNSETKVVPCHLDFSNRIARLYFKKCTYKFSICTPDSISQDQLYQLMLDQKQTDIVFVNSGGSQ